MKKIFIVALFSILISGLFADKITYEKKSIFGKQTYYMNYVKFDGISKGEVYFTYTVAQSSTNDPVVLGTNELPRGRASRYQNILSCSP